MIHIVGTDNNGNITLTMAELEKLLNEAKAEVKEMARKVISELCADDGNRVVAEINAFAGLNKLPTIDIVRCSECKYWNTGEYIHQSAWLPCMAVKTSADWFCADGERKE